MSLNVGDLLITLGVKDETADRLRRFVANVQRTAAEVGTHARGVAAGATSMSVSFARSALKAGAALGLLGAGSVAVGGLMAGVFAGIVGGIAAIGIKAAATAPAVKAAFSGLGASVKADLANAAQVFQGPLIAAAGSLKGMFSSQIAPALQGMFTQLAPLIGQVTKGLGAFLEPMLPAIQAIVAAVTPMMAQLAGSMGTFGGQLAGFLGPITQVLAQNSGLLATLVTGIGGVLQALGPVFAALVQVGVQVAGPLMGALRGVGQALAASLAPVLVQLGPVIGQLVMSIGQIAVALIPLLPPFLQLAATLASALMPVLVQVAQALTAALQPVLVALQPVLGQIASAFGQVIVALLPILPPLSQLMVALLPPIMSLVKALTPVLVMIAGIFAKLVGAITPFLPPLIQLNTAILPVAISFVTALAKVLKGDFKGAFDTVKNAATTFGKTIKAAFAKLQSAGKDLVEGIKNGFVNAWNSFVSAAGGLFTSFISWIKGLLGIRSPSTVMAGIGADTAKGWVVGLTGEQDNIKSTAAKLVDTVVTAFRSGKITGGVKDSLVEAVRSGNKELKKLADERLKIAEAMKKALEFAASTTDSIKQGSSLSNMDFGDSGPSSSAIREKLSARLAQIRRFASVIKKLAKRGLSKTMMQQVIEAGVDGGTELGEALMQASNADFRAINSLSAQIDKAAKQAGKNAADAMFDAGKNAGKGFLTGLTSQKAQIIAAMKDIANALVAQIKKALKQKSPSRVFMDIGMNTMAGLELGIVGAAPKMIASAVGVAGQLSRSFTPKLAGGVAPGGVGGRVSHTTVNVTNHYPQAEPTSRTVNRGLQVAAVIGLA